MHASPPDDALRGAVAAYSGSLVRLAYTYLGNVPDSEDAVQEAFLAYLRKAPAFADAAHEKAWLIRVTANKCKDALRRRKAFSTVLLTEDVADAPASDRELLEAVLGLPEKYRLPLHLHYYEGYSLSEIARIMNARPATVGSWLSRGRDLLRERTGGLFDA